MRHHLENAALFIWTALSFIAIGLKLDNTIDWPWWLVLMPAGLEVSIFALLIGWIIYRGYGAQ